ncbi:MFS transporter [Bacillus sp. Bva_UNVM-123]|uniref:MFS transporter n=1 Tax=Bacillus sp. Bva_UNVM-123 TaxID=2829798 RepID=UPI00391F6D52
MNKIPFKLWKYPALLLCGIGISNIGAWIYLIALNLIILAKTNSPLAVAALYVLVPMATLCSNFWSGSFIDRINKRTLMIFLDFFRACCIFLLPSITSLTLIYVLVFIINIAGSIFAPTSMVYMTKLIPKKDRQRFNALRNFINSCGFLLGPSIAGLLFLVGTPFLAIKLNAIALVISGLIIMLLPNVEKEKKAESSKVSWMMIKKDWQYVISFSKSSIYVATVYLLFSGVTVFMTALDSLEAAFAKEVLYLSDSTYGFLVSIAGGGIIVGSILNTMFAKKLMLNRLIGVGTIFTAIGYIIYAFSDSFFAAALGFFILTFSLSFANTGFLTFYQNNVPVEIMGRFSSMFGMIEALFIIIFTIAFGFIAEIISIRFVIIGGSFGLFILVLFFNKFVFQRSKREYYHFDNISEKITR